MAVIEISDSSLKAISREMRPSQLLTHELLPASIQNGSEKRPSRSIDEASCRPPEMAKERRLFLTLVYISAGVSSA